MNIKDEYGLSEMQKKTFNLLCQSYKTLFPESLFYSEVNRMSSGLCKGSISVEMLFNVLTVYVLIDYNGGLMDLKIVLKNV